MARDIETLYVQLGYSPAQADCILDYLVCHRLEEGGRYRLLCPDTGDEDDEPEWVSAVVYSHPWSSDFLMDESTIMCSLRFNTRMPGIDRVMVSPEFDFNWDAVWAELADIERAALGETIHGRALSPKRQIATSKPIDEAESTGILAESVNFPLRVSLSYSPEDFTRLLTYIKRHEFPFRGRYDLPSEMRDDAEVDLAVFKITVFSGRPFGAKGPSPAHPVQPGLSPRQAGYRLPGACRGL